MMDCNQVIKLNVGGMMYHTTKHTLLVDSNSRLAKMFSDDKKQSLLFHQAEQGINGEGKENQEIFIDREGTYFRYLLNYLRTGHLVLPEDKNALKEILLEAQYFNIRGIVDELSKPHYRSKGILPKPPDDLQAFSESLILVGENKRKLVDWVGDGAKGSRLLYRATRDGWSANIFHFLCDYKASTVVVVRKGSSVFGGYTEQSWSGSGNKTDDKAFLFSLATPSGLGPIKIPLEPGEEEDAIFCHPGQGPVFGRGRDLMISDHANQNNCSSRLGNSYKCPVNQIPTLFFAGTLTFTVSELEVFEIN